MCWDELLLLNMVFCVISYIIIKLVDVIKIYKYNIVVKIRKVGKV